jgi:SAM-dependent methyltransferase
VSVLNRYDELPFATQSIDLVVMPHILEFAAEPHQVLREVDRVLVPEGHVVITGFNPLSLWGVRQWLTRLGMQPYLPREGQFIGLPRVKDWLKLLSFEVNRGRFGCYLPWVRSDRWLQRWRFMDKAGDRWWPVLGSIYMVTAVKRVRGMRLVGAVRKRVEVLRPALAPAASRVGRVQVEPVVEAVSARIAARDAANDPPTLLGGDGAVAIDGGVR